MAVEDPLPEFLPDGAGVAAVYFERAKEKRREALIAYRSHRPQLCERLLRDARALENAARFEVVDPIPTGLEPSDTSPSA